MLLETIGAGSAVYLVWMIGFSAKHVVAATAAAEIAMIKRICSLVIRFLMASVHAAGRCDTPCLYKSSGPLCASFFRNWPKVHGNVSRKNKLPAAGSTDRGASLVRLEPGTSIQFVPLSVFV